MNALRLLLVMIATSQIGFAQNPNSQDRDFGWQVLDGELEYIVQITPAKLLAMQTRSVASPAGEELQSYMPRELVGRVRRVVVRIGDTPLPHTPSLLEIERTFPHLNTANDVAAALGPGSFSDIESNNLKNVQGSGLPQFPFNQGTSGGFGSPNSPTGSNPVDAAAAISAGALPPFNSTLSDPATTANDRFQAGAAGRQSPSTSPNLPALPGSSPPLVGTNKYESTAQRWDGQASSNSGLAGDPRALPATGAAFPQATQDAYGYQNRTAPQLPNNNSAGFDSSQNTLQNFGAAANSLDRDALARDRGQAYPGYADPYGRQSYSGDPRDSYAQSGLPINGQQNTAPWNGGYTGGYSGPATATHVASNAGHATSGIPATPEPADGKPASGSTETNAESTSPSPTTTAIQLFLLLSLVVNVYLGWLIQRLLTRYRHVLTSLRGQTA